MSLGCPIKFSGTSKSTAKQAKGDLACGVYCMSRVLSNSGDTPAHKDLPLRLSPSEHSSSSINGGNYANGTLLMFLSKINDDMGQRINMSTSLSSEELQTYFAFI